MLRVLLPIVLFFFPRAFNEVDVCHFPFNEGNFVLISFVKISINKINQFIGAKRKRKLMTIVYLEYSTMLIIYFNMCCLIACMMTFSTTTISAKYWCTIFNFTRTTITQPNYVKKSKNSLIPI